MRFAVRAEGASRFLGCRRQCRYAPFFWSKMKDEKEILRKSIIERMAIKESVYGLTARDAKNTEDEEARLLLYYDEAEFKSFQEHLGEELFNDVIKYNVLYNNKQNIILNKVPPNN